MQATSFNPARADFEPYGLTCVHWQPSIMPRPDHHNEIELNFLKSGSVTYLIGGRKVVAEAGKLFVFWASIPHQITQFNEDTDYAVATIPLQDFLYWRLPEFLVQALLQGDVLAEPTARLGESDKHLFERWIEDLSGPDNTVRDTVLLEMRARLARLARNLLPMADEEKVRGHLASVPDSGMSKVEGMACFIAMHYTEPLTVQQIAQSVGLHPNYAMTIFQKAFGTTLVSYLTQHRVSHAQRLLVSTNAPVIEIALESGFNSISRFNEAFARISGASPRSYRNRHGPARFERSP